ncbi:MAG: amidohydrolase family protein [Betaproteobacteria bacterium]|nr:amidohydrolase family protein [Betaproteobacteria bacterium]
MAKILFKNVNVLDCTGAPPYAGQVLVEGNRIKAVAPQGSTIPAEGARAVDGGGATLMPGLIESHSHITFLDTPDLEGLGFVPPEEHMLRTVKNAKKMLDQGFTACNSAASAKPRLDVVLRNAINAGDFPGPRTLAASPEMTVTAGLGDVRLLHMHRETFAVICDGAEEFRKMARLMVREGVDTLKINPSGDEFIPHARAHHTVMNEAEIAAVCDVGHAHGKRIAAHARSAESVKLCLKHGVAVIYHATLVDDEATAALEKAKDWCFVAPTLGINYTTLNEAAKWGITTQVAESMGMRIELDTGIKNMKELKKRGVRVLPGGDYGFAWNPIGTNARDIEHFVNLLGFSPMDAILSATKLGGEIMKAGNEMGQVRPGFLADMILVDGNPVANVKLLQDANKLLMIMKDGQFHKEPQFASQSQRQIA